MVEDKKPLNPLERQENIGIVDGSDHTGEAVTTGRHGFGVDVADAGPKTSEDGRSRDPAPGTEPRPKGVA